MEQDRTPAVLPHHPQLARQTSDQPRGHHQQHRRDHHPHRAHSPHRPGHPPYPLGIRISDEQLHALPLTPHDWHGEWNNTLHPTPAAPDSRPADPDPDPDPDPDDLMPSGFSRTTLTHPALTGMSRQNLTTLNNRLQGSWTALGEALFHERYHRPPANTKGYGQRGRLPRTNRILVTLLRWRHHINPTLLGKLYGMDRSTISRITTDTRRLMELHGIAIEPATTHRIRTTDDLTTLLDQLGIPTEIKNAS